MSEHEQKISLQDEELLAMDTDLSSKIHTAVLATEDMGQRERELIEIAFEFKDVFKDHDEALLFAMLPLSKETRKLVLARAREFQASK